MVSVFKKFSTQVGLKEINLILEEIKNGKFQKEVNEIRELIKKGSKVEADKKKRQLDGFTASAQFKTARKAHLAENYSGFIILDLDKLSESELKRISNLAKVAPYTYTCFISPSGNGLKILVKVDSELEHHAIAYNQVAEYYEKSFEVALDKSGKDVSRLCFYSHDPELYLNTDSEIFAVNKNYLLSSESNTSESEEAVANDNAEIDKSSLFQKMIDFTNNKESYFDGNRNNYIYLLACNCNRIGIPENEAEELILQHFDIDKLEAIPSINSAYKNHTDEFAKFANIANNKEDNVQSKDQLLMNMPYLPTWTYEKLPKILQEGCRVLTDNREKDIFITGALSILSGCMRNVSGLYRGKEHFSNLFVFIIAPAASGKGAITFAKQLGDAYHDTLVKESLRLKAEYEVELAEYKRLISDKKANIKDLVHPNEPNFKVLFIPANNSSARIIQHLKEGDEQGVFCETEADTMGNVLKQDWGSYSDLLRKAFHHEHVSYSRKTNKEWIEIKKPRLSVALAGTPGQVEGLIKSAEDGLFSRFIFYTFKSETIWVDAGPTINGVNLSKHFEQLSNQTLKFVQFLEYQKEINFHLTETQWSKLNAFGADCLNNLSTFVSEDLASTSKRLGLILFRVSMVITSLRYFDNAEASSNFVCNDEDFEIALSIVKSYIDHAVFIFKELPKNATVTDQILKSFFDALPNKFQRKEAISIAQKLSIAERTADLYLSKLESFKWLKKPRSGQYTKIKK
ncbi:MAG: DUF3987 domain-containing protein [Bacteroidota bacterium]|jgi:hypothetical protein